MSSPDVVPLLDGASSGAPCCLHKRMCNLEKIVLQNQDAMHTTTLHLQGHACMTTSRVTG